MVGHTPRDLKQTLPKSRGLSLTRRRRRKQPWFLEGLEDRLLLSGSPTIYTVNSTGNGTTGTGDSGTLPYVIGQANANSNTDGSEIQFDPTVFALPQTITLASTLALSETAGPEVIDGPGMSVVTVSGNNAVEVFSAATGVTAALSGLTVSDGSGNNSGGIGNAGTMTITDCAIDNNSESNTQGGSGVDNVGSMTITDSSVDNNFGTGTGGIENDGSMTITDSTIAGNSGSLGNAGGINNVGSLTVTDSTIAGNSANLGDSPGIFNFGSMTITGSAITKNSGGIENLSLMTIASSTIADNHGGGIVTYSGELTITNATIADNYLNFASPGDGPGGLNVVFGTVILYNTIIAQNFGGDYSGAPEWDIAGTVSSTSAYNLIGTFGSGGLTNRTNGNQVGVANPGLGMLANNGGPTQTIALLSNSPAIDKGSNSLAVEPATDQPLTTDQRGIGFSRIVNNIVDIGAFEFQRPPTAATRLGLTVQPPSTILTGSTFGLIVSALDSAGVVTTSFNDTVTVALLNNPGGATLGGTLSVTAQGGVATFSRLTLDQVGNGYTLQVTSNGLTAATTNVIDVQINTAPTHYTVDLTSDTGADRAARATCATSSPRQTPIRIPSAE